MGGHGGLNILPQKRWNVYNRDNRLKVARDEAKHAEHERELQEKHRAAEAQARRKLLLERAKERRAAALGGITTADGVALAESDAEGVAEHDDHDQLAPADEQQQTEEEEYQQQEFAQQQQQQKGRRQRVPQRQLQQLQAEQQEEPETVLEHINFWKELETKAQHPERLKEQRDEKKRRGDPDTYTTDARFDESFQLGYGLTGPKPWYARPVDPTAIQQEPQQQLPGWQGLPAQQQQQKQKRQLALPASAAAADDGYCDDSRRRHKRRKLSRSNSSSSDSSSSSSGSDSDSDSSGGHRKRRKQKKSSKKRGSSSSSSKHAKHKRSQKHKKHKSKHRHSSPDAAAAAQQAEKALALSRLRAERLAREAAERQRSMEATGKRPIATKRYNSSYGYADALKASAAVTAVRGAAAAAVAGINQRFRA